MKLKVDTVSWETAAQTIVDNISLQVSQGQFVGLLGPNGSGKSTLLRMIYRLLRPSAGLITLDDHDVWRLSARETARCIAVLAQENHSDFDFNVHEIVLMGRNPHKQLFEPETREDHQRAQQALHRVGAADLARRSFQTLSGGEKQRVLIARALVQQAKVLVLDEPTNHLDIRYQFEIMSLIRTLGVASIAALHELNLAAQYCDWVYLIDAGKLVASGIPAAVLTPHMLAQVYGIRAEVNLIPNTDKPYIMFIAHY